MLIIKHVNNSPEINWSTMVYMLDRALSWENLTEGQREIILSIAVFVLRKEMSEIFPNISESTPIKTKEILFKHVKSDVIYQVIFEDALEVNKNPDRRIEEPMTVYKNTVNGVIWVRPTSEFMDGRFIRVELDNDER